VESEHFLLKDESGATRGEFTMTPLGPVLNLLGPDGKIIWSTNPRAIAEADGSGGRAAGN